MEKKVQVSGEFIQLNQLLKLENVVQSGGEAKALIESGISRSGRKQVVDKIAAAVILQQWLEKNK